MPMTADREQLLQVRNACLAIAAKREKMTAYAVMEQLMALPCVPMHGPVHHFVMPAALLTAAHLGEARPITALEAELDEALARTQGIPGAICGLCGCCGAAVGTGVFASIRQGTTPLSGETWATGNAITSAALAAIASVNGPRCCKRDSFLALSAVVPLIRDRLGLDLGPIPAIQCRHFAKNRQCRGTECPFFPEKS